MPPIDPATLPSDPEALMALLPPDIRAQAEMLAMFAPPEQRDAVIGAMPRLIQAVTDGDGAAFASALDALGFGAMAPMIWEMAREFVTGD